MSKYTLTSVAVEVTVDQSYQHIKKMDGFSGVEIMLKNSREEFPLDVNFKQNSVRVDSWDEDKTYVTLMGSGNTVSLLVDWEEYDIYEADELPTVESITKIFMNFEKKNGMCGYTVNKLTLSFSSAGADDQSSQIIDEVFWSPGMPVHDEENTMKPSEEMQSPNNEAGVNETSFNQQNKSEGETHMSSSNTQNWKSIASNVLSFVAAIAVETASVIVTEKRFQSLQTKKVSELEANDIHFLARFDEMKEAIAQAEEKSEPLSRREKTELLGTLSEKYTMEEEDLESATLLEKLIMVSLQQFCEHHSARLQDKTVAELDSNDLKILVQMDLRSELYTVVETK